MSMAEDRPGGQPTEPPSEKRLRDARRRGEVARSRDLVSAVVFGVVALTVSWSWPDLLLGQLRDAMARGLRTATGSGMLSMGSMLHEGIETLVMVSAPVLIAAFVAAVVAGFLHVGPVYALHPLKPNLQRLHPLKNLKGVLGKAALYEMFKSLVKIVGGGVLALDALWDHLPQILRTLGRSPEAGLLVVSDCLVSIALRVAILMAALAAFDLLYQRYAHRKRLRMTKLEVQREQKEMEGDPQRKAERKRIHREIVDHQMLESVALADCVIVNPDHVAVALRYDREKMEAPKVIARGQRLMAAKIKQIAKEHGIPIIRNVPLARALVELEVDEEIPPELYEAVAEVLRFVYRVSSR